MKYVKPEMEIEKLEMNDIVTASNGGSTVNGSGSDIDSSGYGDKETGW